MRRELIESSAIVSIGYDAERRELDIEFLESGDVYRYFEVPPDEHQAFMAAESKGEYLNKVFKPLEYRYVIIQRGHTRAS